MVNPSVSATRRERQCTCSGKNIYKTQRDKCCKCGCFEHTTKKCCTHCLLIDLYEKSLGKYKRIEGTGYEAHFNARSDMKEEAGGSRPMDIDMPPMTSRQDIDMENKIIEYNSNDVYRYQN